MKSLWLDTAPHIPADTFEAARASDTLVVGAGLTGLTTAVLLARAGHSVAVLEARTVGAVTTGNTTAKVSLLQATQFSRVRSHHGDDTVRAYAEAQREGKAWMLQFCQGRGISYDERDAYTIAMTSDGLDALDEERDASTVAGIELERLDAVEELPFGVAGAVRLRAQAQVHPLEVLAGLAAELRERGGVLVEGVRVTDVDNLDGTDASRALQVETTAGTVVTDRVVLATGTPILDRGGHFALLKPGRSYVSAFTVPGPIPKGMHVTIDEPGRSLRTARAGDRELLLVGGNGHPVGREENAKAKLDDLAQWTREHWPGAELTHSWSAQDYEPAAAVPYVGALAGSDERIFVATGYNKWGMANGVAASLALAALILEGANPWADALYDPGLSVKDAGAAIATNASVAAELVSGWLGGLTRTLDAAPPEGAGEVVRSGARLVGVSTVGGHTRRVSAVCTHLGGALSWNDAECSWDCPLHGSRFAADGTVLEGPARKNLDPIPDPNPDPVPNPNPNPNPDPDPDPNPNPNPNPNPDPDSAPDRHESL